MAAAKTKLTAKQEGFVQDAFKGETFTQAYRNNYNNKNMAEKTIWEAASRLMADSKVTARLIQLQETAAERSQVTVMSLTKEMDENRARADELEQVATMQSASMGKAKLHGLLVDKAEIKGAVDTKWTIEVVNADKDAK